MSQTQGKIGDFNEDWKVAILYAVYNVTKVFCYALISTQHHLG